MAPGLVKMLTYAYWPLACLLMAAGQGLLLPAIRRTPPGPEAKRQAFALHWLLTAAYLLPLVLAPHTWPEALGSRLLLFDPTINLASGSKVFAVGSTAASDRLFRRLAPVHPERLRLGLWVGSLVLTALLLYLYQQ